MKLDKQTWGRIVAVDMLFLCFSLNVSLVGQMFDSIKTYYGLSFSQGGLLLSMQSVGGLLLSVVCILFISALNKTKLLVVCGVLLCSMLMVVGVLPPLFLLFVVFAALGFSGGAINTLANSVMVDIVPTRAERYITFLHMLFSLGAVVSPILAQAIFPAVGLTGVFLLFGGFALCWGAFALYAFRSQVKPRMLTCSVSFSVQLRAAVAVLKTRGMGITFVISILITAWQLSAIYYISSYFTRLSGNEMQGALALSLLFLGMMVSRLLYARIADRFPKGRVLLLTNAAGLLAWMAVLFVPDYHIKYIFVVLAALFCGNNFPITFSTACRIVPHNTAAASGFVNLGYYIAIFTIIPLVGTLGDTLGLGNALLCLGLPLLLMIPASLLLHKRLISSVLP